MSNILLIISGGIAAYKSLDIIRNLTKDGVNVTVVLTKAAKEFVTPMSVEALSGNKIYDDLFSLTDEAEMGHIRLARMPDAILVAPASADIIAKMANGMANDLASTILLATDRPIFIAPAMNVKMWENKAVQRNIEQIKADGIEIIGPDSGDLACGEKGEGRMSQPDAIIKAIKEFLNV